MLLIRKVTGRNQMSNSKGLNGPSLAFHSETVSELMCSHFTVDKNEVVQVKSCLPNHKINQWKTRNRMMEMRKIYNI